MNNLENESTPEYTSDIIETSPNLEVSSPVEVDTALESDPVDETTPAISHLPKNLEQVLEKIEGQSAKIATEIRDIHKLYHGEFAGRLKKMQDELDAYHEIDKGRVYDSILLELANLYSNNENLPPKLENKQLKYMFLDLLQVLEGNGVGVQKSKPGDERHSKYCQIIEQVTTDDEGKHNTVISSENTGFYVENRPLVKERVRIYVYQKPTEEVAHQDVEPSNETAESETDTTTEEQ